MSTASICPSSMILPTVTSLATDAIAAVPDSYRDGSYGLGCTRWQTIVHVEVPSAMREPGVVFSREVLLQRVWGWDFDGGSRTVDVHVQQLRAKLGDAADLIETVRGVGYRMRSLSVFSKAGRSKYQLSTRRSSGVVPVSWLTGFRSSSGSNWWPRSHSSA